MDRNRNRKRKANEAASPKVEGSASKRQKTRLVSADASCGLSESWLDGRVVEMQWKLCASPRSTVMVMLRAR
jgi:hypothetical protein